MTATLAQRGPFAEAPGGPPPSRRFSLLEAVSVLASPGILYFILRLRAMGPPQLPDPAMHTTFVIAPHDIFMRYQALFDPTSRLREAGRVGFLVPARLSYLMFGALPGFFVYRYVLALIAVVPVYLLLRRLYGRAAGFLGIALIMSSPVVITAWGTDYPDSAALSYLTGALAALALAGEVQRGRRAWLAGAGALLTAAVWTHGVAVPLVLVALAVYGGLRLWHARPGLILDLALLLATAIGVTVLLAVLSKLLIGQLNFISPTIRSARQLSTPGELRVNHSVSWGWAQYDDYLLVPVAVCAAYVLVFAGRIRQRGPAVVFIGLAGCLSVALFFALQFLSSFQALEQHYFSSVLWSVVNIMLAMTVAEVVSPISATGRRGATSSVGRVLSSVTAPLLALGVVWVYEIAYKLGGPVPAMSWRPWGLIVAALVILGALVGRINLAPGGSGHLSGEPGRARIGRGAGGPLARRALATAGALVMLGAVLVLTVAQAPPHKPVPNTVYDPPPSYALALDGNGGPYEAEYAVLTQLPSFAGAPAYRGEVLLTWVPARQYGDLLGPMGIFHNAFTWVSESFPVLSPGGAGKIARLHAAQVLLMSLTGQDFARAVGSLARFRPVVVKRAVISHGWYHLHVWLVDLGTYLRPARS